MDKLKIKNKYKSFYSKNFDYYKKLEYKRKSFADSKLTNDYISEMKLDDYVIGKKDKSTFCYQLEYGLKELGDIRRATAAKYCVYYSEKYKKYITQKRFKDDYEKAFDFVKDQIQKLFDAGQKNDFESIKKIQICEIVKLKLLYLKFPDKYLPIYSNDNLIYIINCLGLNSVKDTIQNQQIIIDYFRKLLSDENLNLLSIMFFVYNLFGRPIENQEAIADEILNEELHSLKNENHDFIMDVNVTEKSPLVALLGKKVYPRNFAVSSQALINADYKCEIDEKHQTFITKTTKKRYMEAHHLVPLSQHDKFNCSLDVVANVVCLCSNCHNEIHYGENRYGLIEKLYNKRKVFLEKVGLKDLTLDDLKKMYK